MNHPSDVIPADPGGYGSKIGVVVGATWAFASGAWHLVAGLPWHAIGNFAAVFAMPLVGRLVDRGYVLACRWLESRRERDAERAALMRDNAGLKRELAAAVDARLAAEAALAAREMIGPPR